MISGNQEFKDTLYYDGTCPLCSFEINHLRNLSDGDLALVDVHQLQPENNLVDSSQCHTKNKARLLKRLHLVKADGTIVTGLDATARAWRHTRFGVLLTPLTFPGIRIIADWCYRKWATRRFNKRYPEMKQ